MEVVDGLTLFVEDGNDVDPATSAEGHQERLHRPDAEVIAAGFGIAVHAYGITRRIPGFETEVAADPLQLNTCHFQFLGEVTAKPPEAARPKDNRLRIAGNAIFFFEGRFRYKLSAYFASKL